ncbi:MAG: hypothetical protein U0T81_01825 [Saprospiraceae bacterium]
MVGLMNLLGVLASSYLFGMAVATKISSILPMDTVLNRSTHEAIAMVLAVLIFWIHNLESGDLVFRNSMHGSSHTMMEAYWSTVLYTPPLPKAPFPKVGVNWNEAIKIDIPSWCVPFSASQWPSS